MSNDETFMRLAIEQARMAGRVGEVPIGAVITDREGNILSRAHNTTEVESDPTSHAEINAIRQAARQTGEQRLRDATIYVTIEPCVMCIGAIILSRIERLVFGARDEKAGAVYSVYNIGHEGLLNHSPEIRESVCEEECARLMKDFFSTLRQNR